MPRVPCRTVHNVGHSIHADVLASRAGCRRVHVEREYLRGAQAGGRDGQNTGAGPEVQHVSARYGHCLQQLQTELGAGVESRAERQPRIERNHEIVGPGCIVEPRGGDNPTPAYPERVIVLPPSNLPVFPLPSQRTSRVPRGAKSKARRMPMARVISCSARCQSASSET